MPDNARDALSELCDDWHLGCMQGTEKTPKQILNKALASLRKIILAEKKMTTLSGDRDRRLEMIGWNSAVEHIATLFGKGNNV